MYIDYSKIVLTDMKQVITDENLEELKEIAKNEKGYIKRRYGVVYLKDNLDTKATEIAFTSARYKDKSKLEKTIIANNIVFDNQKFANLLRNGNFDAKTLKAFLRILSYLKSKLNAGSLSEKDKDYAAKAEYFTRRLVKYFKLQIGITDSGIIINKINELLSFEPELLDELTNKHTR